MTAAGPSCLSMGSDDASTRNGRRSESPFPTTPHPACWNLELKLPLPMQPPCQLSTRLSAWGQAGRSTPIYNASYIQARQTFDIHTFIHAPAPLRRQLTSVGVLVPRRNKTR